MESRQSNSTNGRTKRASSSDSDYCGSSTATSFSRPGASCSPIQSPRRFCSRFAVRSLQHSAVTAVSFPEIFDGFEEVLPREIGPEFLGHVHLRIGKLPQQEIREPHFAGGANEQIGIGVVAGVKMLAEHVDIDHGAIDVPGIDLAKKALDSIDNFEPAAVPKGE